MLPLLSDGFGFQPQSINACRQRSHLPVYHRYDDHWFVVVHRPLVGRAGHVHLLQLEQFVGRDALVTLHGPFNPDVDPREVGQETAALRGLLDSGRLLAKAPSELSHALVAGLSREYGDVLQGVASRVADLEQHVMNDDAIERSVF